MKNKIAVLGVAAIALATVLFSVGCSATNRQQIINSTSGDGMHGKLVLPITGSTSIGADLMVGVFNSTTVVQPTSTNGPVSSPNLIVAVTGQGKQSVNGSTSTNATAAIANGSKDASVIATGNTAFSNQTDTNAVMTIGGTK